MIFKIVQHSIMGLYGKYIEPIYNPFRFHTFIYIYIYIMSNVQKKKGVPGENKTALFPLHVENVESVSNSVSSPPRCRTLRILNARVALKIFQFLEAVQSGEAIHFLLNYHTYHPAILIKYFVAYSSSDILNVLTFFLLNLSYYITNINYE